MDRTGYGVRDANMVKTKALPSGASTIYTDGIDVGLRGGRGALLADCELEINAPILAVGELANASTMKYDVQMDADVAFGSPTTIALEVLVQTGAGGVGAAAATAKFRLPTNCERYVRVAATNSAAADASGKDVEIAVEM